MKYTIYLKLHFGDREPIVIILGKFTDDGVVLFFSGMFKKSFIEHFTDKTPSYATFEIFKDDFSNDIPEKYLFAKSEKIYTCENEFWEADKDLKHRLNDLD